MGTEFEHKLVVVGDEWRAAVTSSSSLAQAYLCAKPGMTIRVRVVDDSVAYLTIKGRQVGIGRPEYEYEIPVDDARALLAMITDGFPITKTRYELGDPCAGWIVDEFADANAGLVVAEATLIDGRFDDVRRGHLTPEEAVEMALDAVRAISSRAAPMSSWLFALPRSLEESRMFWADSTARAESCWDWLTRDWNRSFPMVMAM